MTYIIAEPCIDIKDRSTKTGVRDRAKAVTYAHSGTIRLALSSYERPMSSARNGAADRRGAQRHPGDGCKSVAVHAEPEDRFMRRGTAGLRQTNPCAFPRGCSVLRAAHAAHRRIGLADILAYQTGSGAEHPLPGLGFVRPDAGRHQRRHPNA